MFKWIIKLEGSNSDFSFISKKLSTEYARLELINGIHYLLCKKFDDIKDSNIVLHKANELLAIIKLIFKYKYGHFLGVDIIGINRLESDGRITQFILPIGIPSEVRFGMTSVVSNIANSESDDFNSILMKTLDHPNIVKAFRLYILHDNNWDNLYKIFEAIQSDLGSDIVTNNWTTQTEINRFTQTANSVQAIGDQARHGHSRIPSPSNPMTLDEAKVFIETLLERYIKTL